MVTVVKFCFMIYHWKKTRKFLNLKNKISGNGVFLFFIIVGKISLMLEFQFFTTSYLWDVNVSNKMWYEGIGKGTNFQICQVNSFKFNFWNNNTRQNHWLQKTDIDRILQPLISFSPYKEKRIKINKRKFNNKERKIINKIKNLLIEIQLMSNF